MRTAHTRWACALMIGAALLSLASSANAQTIVPYGPSITLEQARSIVTIAKGEAEKNSWPVAISIVDAAGHLVAFERMDNTQLGSIEISQEKAKCAVLFRRPTKAFEDALATGGANLRALKTPGILPIEGGIPILIDGKIAGAIGVSGVQAGQDAQIANAGLEVLKNSSSSSPPAVSPDGSTNSPPARGGRGG